MSSQDVNAKPKHLTILDAGSGVPELANKFQKMANRLVFGAQRYGRIDPAQWDFLASLQERLKKYQETGNTEWLIDAANFAILEATWPKHPEAHFAATTADDSPGAKTVDGEVKHIGNV